MGLTLQTCYFWIGLLMNTKGYGLSDIPKAMAHSVGSCLQRLIIQTRRKKLSATLLFPFMVQGTLTWIMNFSRKTLKWVPQMGVFRLVSLENQPRKGALRKDFQKDTPPRKRTVGNNPKKAKLVAWMQKNSPRKGILKKTHPNTKEPAC